MSGDLLIKEADARTASEKQDALLATLSKLPSLIIALSGGADSAYLAWAANEAIADHALSMTALSASYSAYDREQVEKFVAATRVRHEFVETKELADSRYTANNADRCYFCKDELFRALDQVAAERKLAAIAYGINADDTRDFRPGHRAASEHRVLAPLLDAGMTKPEIRELSRTAGLATWDRPASACLSSRIPYGTAVTPENLARVERAEAALRALGFRQFRVRHYDDTARIEIALDELPRAQDLAMASAIASGVRGAGYRQVTLDLKGYRQGSLNAALGGSSAAPELPASEFRILK
jgi:pyridinium-3,5-biscarboxylic acid mononucleotide sulfurtransferase